MNDAEDAAVLAAGIAGDAEGFSRHFRPLVSGASQSAARASGRPPNPSLLEDLCQEAFLSLLGNGARRLRQFDPSQGTAGAWVAMIAKQAAAKALVRERPAPLAVAGQAPSAAEEAALGEDLARLRNALGRLPPKEGLCLALLYADGLSAPRVAGVLGVERRTVYEIRDRALARLRTLLKNG